jgi:hypothetical protein
VARKAAALRDAEKQLAAAEASKISKEEQLVKAKEAQVSSVRGTMGSWTCQWRCTRPPTYTFKDLPCIAT